MDEYEKSLDSEEVVLSVAEIEVLVERVWDEDTDEKLHSGSMELGFVFEGFLVVFA